MVTVVVITAATAGLDGGQRFAEQEATGAE
jgi:hypothetical protein